MRAPRVVYLALVAAALAGAFAWGALTVRDQIFPYRQLRSLVGRNHGERQDVRANPDLSTLRALGYVNSTFDPAAELSNVVDYDPTRAYAGLNLYGSRDARQAQLVDMEGRVLHRWRGDQSDGGDGWQHIELLPDGRLLATVKDEYLELRDVDSRVLWTLPIGAHHDLWMEGDTIWLNTRVRRVVPDVHPTRAIIDDHITQIDLQGNVLSDWSVLEAMLASSYRFLVPNLTEPAPSPPEGVPDVLHTNHVEIIPDGVPSRNPAFAAGNFLVSMRNINAILVFDGATHAPLWLWGPGILTFQHHPTLLGNGNVLLFDNGIEHSRILEVDPADYAFRWQYRAEGFFSRTRGSVQRLPNGNTLITESDAGWAFETTDEGDVVWSFANPRVDEAGYRSAIWRMVRLPVDFATAWASAPPE